MGLGEFELIERFVRRFRTPRSPFGPGDDAAVLRPGAGRICITTDTVVEGVHFTQPAFSLEDIGHKALAVNLSDLAAMGARPTEWLCSLMLPRRFSARDVDQLAAGMVPLSRRFSLELVGGNVTSSSQLAISITALGVARRPLLRSGARPGDILYVSGRIGDAGAGLKLLRARSRGGAEVRRLLTAQRRPEPRVELGLVAATFAHAAIDVSDGLLADVGHLAAASHIRVNMLAARVPVSLAALSVLGGRVPALSSGEDYELVLAVPKARAARFEKTCSERGLAVARIGVCARGRGVFLDGVKRSTGGGFDHLRRLLTSEESEP